MTNSEEKTGIPISNGHVTKDSSKNTPNRNSNKRMDKGLAEKMEKPVKRVIIQEDIRPCITKEIKHDKTNKNKQDSRCSNFILSLSSSSFL